MKVEATRDFKRPRASVLQKFREPERFEQVLLDLGGKAKRTANPPQASWDCAVHWRDEPRRFSVIMREVSEDETFEMDVTSDMISSRVLLDFYDLPDGGCRVIAQAEATSNTMMGKLALQSLKLVSNKISDRLARLIGALGRA